MPDFLLEIGCEEIPARMLAQAEKDLREKIEMVLVSRFLHLGGQSISRSFSTPRRIAVLVRNVQEKQRDSVERVVGPTYEIAFKGGKPTQAAVGFSKKTGVPIDVFIELHKTARPESRLGADIPKPGRRAVDVLMEALPKEIGSIYWAKNMYWRVGKPERFVRPVRWIVALLDSEIVPLEFAGIKAGRSTYGHRILSNSGYEIREAKDYEAILRGGRVLPDRLSRFQRIDSTRITALSATPGLQWRKDIALIETVENLTEWPTVILGGFEREYLSLPEEVLVTVMRDHQKYFAVEDAQGNLAPHFLAVLNTDGDPDGIIRHGNERVLRARFNDAQFFWSTDQKMPMTERAQMLAAVTFQKDLGSYHDKTARLVKLGTEIAEKLQKSGHAVRSDMVFEAAQLSKADLTTELVKEFTELQGMIGGLYVRAQGLPGYSNSDDVGRIADAIYDQYKPESMEDSPPRSLEGSVLSIADKADSIAGMFSLGLIPSGSKDPFALRRQANGIVKIIAKEKLAFSLAELMRNARTAYQGSDAERKFTLGVDAYLDAVSRFFRERLEFYLRDTLGLAYDVVNAVLAADANDIVDATARAEAVAKVRPSGDFVAISTSFKRMKNILRQAVEGKSDVAEPFNMDALREPEENTLAAAIPQVAINVNALRAARRYEQALLEISQLRPLVDAFFDKVMVMVDDQSLRAQRLGLLQTLVREFSSIADFSEIVLWKPWEQTIWVKRKGLDNLEYVDGRTFERTPAPGVLEIYRGPDVLRRFDDVEDWGLWGDGSNVRSKYKVEY